MNNNSNNTHKKRTAHIVLNVNLAEFLLKDKRLRETDQDEH